MANEEPETVVEDIDEDNSQAVDFNKATVPTPEAKPQSKSQESPVPVVVDEEPAIKKDATPSVEATKDGKSSEDVAGKTQEQVSEKKSKYRLKEENRIPQARFNQVVRQRRIAEDNAMKLQQKHLDLLDYLDRFQKANPHTSLPAELVAHLNASKQEIHEARQAQHTARLDEADEWLKTEMKKYVDDGFQFPSSFEKELVAIVQADGLHGLDPLEAYQKAFTKWSDENISVEEEPTKAETSTQIGSGKPNTPNPQKIREEQKAKAAGVPKAKAPSTTPTKKEEKWSGSNYYAVDEDPRW